MNNKDRKMHYAWKILIACILIKAGSAGAVSAMMGNFVAPIVKELNCQVSEFAMLISICAISMALLYTTASRFLTKKRIGLVMGIASIGEMLGLALMSSYRTVHMFYFSGALIGVAQAFTGFVAIPIVVNMWFKRKTGTVLGIIVAIGSAATIGYGLLSAHLISTYGWRSAYLILAGMAFVITIPAVFLIIKSPAEAGCEPFGADEEPKQAEIVVAETPEWSLTRKQAFRLPLLYIAWIACIFYSYGSGVSGYIIPFTTMELGQSISFGARAGMFLSLGGIACSLILGWINDRFGVKAGLLWGAVTTTAGFLLMFLSFRTPAYAYLASFIVGLGMSMYAVQCPLLARSIVGSKHFSGIWALMMMANSIIGGGLYSSIGLFYDKLGSYKGAFIMAIVLFVAAFFIGSLAIDLSHKYRGEHPHPDTEAA
ncbi:MAG: MFS transporter [Christensenellales bacterium]